MPDDTPDHADAATLAARLRRGRTPPDAEFASKRERWIGRYRLIEILGEGGMGTVYLAEQREPVQRTVALKLMRSSFTGATAAARFSAERQALARLSHPNIAAMYDAGATEAGFPFFAMERVEGIPVTDYCDQHRLTIRQRVELLIQICKGVEHAHQKGVIHRDLKPSNVLVADAEGRALPKIIDFGIAKAIDQPLSDVTAVVTSQGVMGTPAYMSPEALGGGDLDTRTDVYSLGVILYELIAGARPHNVDDLPLGMVIRLVMERDADLPLVRYRTLTDTARTRVAAARREDERSLAGALGGDLGWIARKATARGPEERYGSAADLAADLARFLNHEPVLATPPSLGYRARKFARRHRASVIAGAIIALVLVGGIAGTTIGMLRAQHARAEAEAVSTFLTDLLESASPWNRKNETTVRQLLEEAAGKISTELKDQPAARAELLQTIGSSEFHLGHLDSAERLLREALRLRIELEGPESGRVAGVLNDLGMVRKHQDQMADAEQMLRRSLVIREKAYGHEHGSVARGLFDLASILAERGKNGEAEAAYRESLALRERLKVEPHEVALTMNGLGLYLARTGRFAEAEAKIRKSLEIRRQAGSTGYAYALSLLELGKIVERRNRLAEAEALDREGLAALEKFVEADDNRLRLAREQLANVVRMQK